MKVLLMFILSVPTVGFATPVVFPKYPETLAKVLQVEGVGVVGDNQNPNVFYVTPPTSGLVTSSDLFLRNANLGFCSTIASLKKSADDIATQLAGVEESYTLVHAESVHLESVYNIAQANADGLKVSSSVLGQIANFDSKIIDDQNRLDRLYSQLDTCDKNCHAINNEIISVQDDLRTNQQARQNLARDHIAEVKQYERAVATAGSAKRAWQSKGDEVLDEEKQIKELSALHAEVYGQYAHLEGGYVHIDYNSRWDEKIQDLINQNRGANPTFSFQKMDTHDVTVHAVLGVTDQSSYLESSPAVLSYTVAGQNSDGTIKLNSLPSHLSVDLRLSVVGACPIAYPELFKVTGATGSVAFGISADYNYYSAYESHAHFWVDERQFYQKVMNAGSSGFLFWKHNWQTMDLTQLNSDAYRFEWNLSDPNNQISLADRRATEAQAVNFIIARLVSQYSKSTVAVDPINPPVPTSGLTEVGKGLLQLCGTSNFYCAASGFVMMSLDEIFAGGSSTSNGTRIFRQAGDLEWNDTILQSVPASTVFGILPPSVSVEAKGVQQ